MDNATGFQDFKDNFISCWETHRATFKNRRREMIVYNEYIFSKNKLRVELKKFNFL